jgi:hypothetical protein
MSPRQQVLPVPLVLPGPLVLPVPQFPPGCPVVNDMDATLMSLGRHQSGIDAVTASPEGVTGGATGMNVTTEDREAMELPPLKSSGAS